MLQGRLRERLCDVNVVFKRLDSITANMMAEEVKQLYAKGTLAQV